MEYLKKFDLKKKGVYLKNKNKYCGIKVGEVHKSKNLRYFNGKRLLSMGEFMNGK